MRARPLAIMLIVVVAVASVAVLAYANAEDSTILMNNPTSQNSLEYNSDVMWAGMGDISIMGSCPSANGSTVCDLTIALGLGTGGGPNYGVATKSITLELMDSPFSQLAIASGLNVPTTGLQVSYSSDNSGDKLATVFVPATMGGATWTYDFVILNPPTSGGKAYLELMIDASLVSTSFFGHHYELEASVTLPGPS